MKYGCKHCIYYEDCAVRAKCEYFTPATEEAEDDIAEKELAESRRIYIESYHEYINGWN